MKVRLLSLLLLIVVGVGSPATHASSEQDPLRPSREMVGAEHDQDQNKTRHSHWWLVENLIQLLQELLGAHRP